MWCVTRSVSWCSPPYRRGRARNTLGMTPRRSRKLSSTRCSSAASSSGRTSSGETPYANRKRGRRSSPRQATHSRSFPKDRERKQTPKHETTSCEEEFGAADGGMSNGRPPTLITHHVLLCLVPPPPTLQYIPDVSRAVFGLLTAMQKRARDGEEDKGGGAGGASKRARGATAKVIVQCKQLAARPHRARRGRD